MYNFSTPTIHSLLSTLIIMFVGVEANAIQTSSSNLSDETMLNGDRHLSVNVFSKWHSLVTFSCLFDKRDEAGEIEMHIESRQPWGGERRIQTGERTIKMKFDRGSILDVEARILEREVRRSSDDEFRFIYEVNISATFEEIRKYLDTSISSSELIYGLPTPEGEIVQYTVELRGLGDVARANFGIFEMRCKHPTLRAAVGTHYGFRLTDEADRLRVSSGLTGNTYEFRCLSRERSDPIVVLFHLESRKPRSGRGGIKLEFESGRAMDVEAEISRDVLYANVVVMHAKALLEEAMASREFTLHIQGRQWDFFAGDLELEVFRNRCLLE